MLVLATNAEPRLCISTFELDEPERQYTVDTLSYFRSRFGADADLFFVLGADSWTEITTWYQWQRLLTLANLIVVTRPGFEVATDHLGEAAATVVDVRGLKTELGGRIGEGPPKIFVTDAVMLDVSATESRQAARENQSGRLNSLVPLEVADYIRKYRLYRNTHED
jgi:nicotinate-nucleotide adenylyltransferase